MFVGIADGYMGKRNDVRGYILMGVWITGMAAGGRFESHKMFHERFLCFLNLRHLWNKNNLRVLSFTLLEQFKAHC